MAVKQEPVPGYYYINLTGQLIKVKALLYVEAHLARVVVEYLDGKILNIRLDEWNWLDLSVYSEWLETRNLESELEYEV
ncbi:hypothetical protein MNBD_GAMMA12-3667 [hydrothermal vent metagenome]|uniref:Uncharacterized protein n=1 Tax=hydrothermal vent metagenome TaxID=652676 RepID=A0A3B0YK12_9ZZZZ